MLTEGHKVIKGPIYDNKGVLRIAKGEEMDDLSIYQNWNWAVQGVEGMP